MSIRQIAGGRWTRFALAVLIAASPTTMLADDLTIAGAAGGMITLGDLVKYAVKGNAAAFAGSEGKVVIRYAMPTDTEIDDACNVDITIRYRDNGALSNVIVRIRQVSLQSSTMPVLFTFDSDGAGAPANTGADQTVTVPSTACFDWGDNAYILEVELNKTGSAGDPRFVGFSMDLTD